MDRLTTNNGAALSASEVRLAIAADDVEINLAGQERFTGRDFSVAQIADGKIQPHLNGWA
jgi:hypothetical protein